MRKINKLLIVLFAMFSCFIMLENVDAATDTKYCIKKSGAAKGISEWINGSSEMSYKWVMDYKDPCSNVGLKKSKLSYCATFGHPSNAGFVNGYYSTKKCADAKWFTNEGAEPYIIGQIYKQIVDKKYSDAKEYTYVVLALNTYYKLYGNKTGAVNFSKEITKANAKKDYGSNWSFIYNHRVTSKALRENLADWVKTAKTNGTKIYNSASRDVNVPVPTVKVDGTAVKEGGASSSLSKKELKNNKFEYLSGVIEFSQKSKLADDVTAISNSVTVTGANATVQYCTGTSYKSCASSVDLSKKFKIKITSSAALTDMVKVSFVSKATTKYWTGSMVCHTDKRTNQALAVFDENSKPLSKAFELNLKPQTSKKEISVLKVDEYGKAVAGAEVEMYEGDNKLTLTKSSDNTMFTYGSDDAGFTILGKTFKITETKAPNGFVKLKDVKTIQIPSSVKSGEICNKTVADEDTPDQNVDEKYCKSVYMCKKSDGTLGAIPENESDCSSYNIAGVTPPSGDTDGTIAPTNNDTTGQDGGTTSDGSDGGITGFTSEKVCTYNGAATDNNAYCENPGDYYTVKYDGNSMFVNIYNERNTVTISKKATTGDVEVPGASLKICKKDGEDGYDKLKNDCKPAKTIDEVELQWVSTDEEQTFNGLTFGDYYLLETLPPSGYKLVTTATNFSIDQSGEIKTGSTKAPNNLLVLHNALNEVTISKTDIVTTKELPGAELSICVAKLKTSEDTANYDEDGNASETTNTTETTTTTATTTTTTTATTSSTSTADAGNSDQEESKDANDYTPVLTEGGNCLPVNLADGSVASWTSGNKPHTIKGLPTGTYYLVETTAPNGYATTESILFKMNNKGELTDVAGNSLKDNKIVMKDAPINQVKTGNTALIVTIIGAIIAAAASIYFFSFHKVEHTGVVNSGVLKKVKTRRIHKK